MKLHYPIIQGGMGAGISHWHLARTVAMAGQVGVVSGIALDSILIRRLQSGDGDGAVRRALSAYPNQIAAKRVLDRFFIDGGKSPDAAYRLISLPTANMSVERMELMVIGTFVECWLAREGHNGVVGINFLEKIQLPLLPGIFGAMLAGVDVILMGAGLPLYVPDVLAKFAQLEPATIRVSVEGENGGHVMSLSPLDFVDQSIDTLSIPAFLSIVSSETAARVMIKRASGPIDGFVVENHSAGGHNAPPRARVKEGGLPTYSERDWPVMEKIAALGKPFWIAGGYATPGGLKMARSLGATGIQVGTPFALCNDSGMAPTWRQMALARCLDGSARIQTDFFASPTGYPFKVFSFNEAISNAEHNKVRKKRCDLGYLRSVYQKENGKLGYRCPSEPLAHYQSKGGRSTDVKGRLCVCNGLMSTMGLPQCNDGVTERPLVTLGEDVSSVVTLAAGRGSYGATDVINYLLSED